MRSLYFSLALGWNACAGLNFGLSGYDGDILRILILKLVKDDVISLAFPEKVAIKLHLILFQILILRKLNLELHPQLIVCTFYLRVAVFHFESSRETETPELDGL